MGIKAGIGLLDDEQVRSAVEEFLRRRAEEFPVAEPAGNLLGQVVADKAHVPLIDLIAGSLHDWLRDNQTRVVDVVERQAPGWSPKWADDLVAQKVYREAVKFAQAVRDDKMHPLRTSIDEALLQLSNDLRFDADMQFRAEQAKIGCWTTPRWHGRCRQPGPWPRDAVARPRRSDLRPAGADRGLLGFDRAKPGEQRADPQPR